MFRLEVFSLNVLFSVSLPPALITSPVAVALAPIVISCPLRIEMRVAEALGAAVAVANVVLSVETS